MRAREAPAPSVPALTGLAQRLGAGLTGTYGLQPCPTPVTLTARAALNLHIVLRVREGEGTPGRWAGQCGGQVLFMETWSINLSSDASAPK